MRQSNGPANSPTAQPEQHNEDSQQRALRRTEKPVHGKLSPLWIGHALATVEVAAAAAKSACWTACLKTCELAVAPVTAFTVALWLATTWAGSDAIWETGKVVAACVIATLAILPAEVVKETVMLPKRPEPVPV